MGLIKALTGSVGGVLADQWKEYFYCPSMPADVIVTKGEKKVSKRSSNTKGTDNIISNGSVIVVNEGQCMIIVDQGQIVEFCAQAGEFVYDASKEASLLYGKLGENIGKSVNTYLRKEAYKIHFEGRKEVLDEETYSFRLESNTKTDTI